MKTIKLTLTILATMVASQSFGMGQLFAPKQQTAAGQARESIRQARGMLRGVYAQTMQQAYQGTPAGEVLGLKAEVAEAVKDLATMGGEVKELTDDVQGVADVGLEIVEEEVKKNAFLAKRPKLKRQVLKFVSEARTVVPTTITAGLIAYLAYCYWQSQKTTATEQPGWYTLLTNQLGGFAVRYKLGQLLNGAQTQAPAVATEIPVTVIKVDGGTTTKMQTMAMPGQPVPTVQNPGMLAKIALSAERTVGNGVSWMKKSIWG